MIASEMLMREARGISQGVHPVSMTYLGYVTIHVGKVLGDQASH